tara:strand:- start:4995 stop:9680 length:4686 start_codon:yes stop_codon:yes gene_type:complete
MTQTIKTQDNTFYVKKDVVDDIGIVPAYADAYIGMSPTYDIKSNPDTSFYLVESNTVSESDYVYGEGKISEIYLSLYVNSLTQKNPQTGNWLDVFSLKPNIDITEGNMTIASGNFGGPTLLYNSYNSDGAWMTEDFDGQNKDFMDAPLRAKKTINVTSPGLQIPLGKLLMLSVETNRSPPKEEYTWANPVKNLQEEVDQALDWAGYYVTNITTDIMVWAREGLFGEDSALADMISLVKGQDGLFQPPDLQRALIDVAFAHDTYGKHLEAMRKPATWWVEKGATWEASMALSPIVAARDYSVMDETFVAKCTQDNSIFSDAYEAPNVRDIKDQTLEGPGDTPEFIAYSYQNLVNAESPTDGLCLRMKCFWENYTAPTGASTNENNWNTANAFGRHEYLSSPVQAYPQVVHSSIYGIPQPTPIDITTSGTRRPTYAPEIEIVFKINRMDVSTYVGTGSLNEGNFLSLDRSFNIIFNDYAPIAADDGEAVNNLYEASTFWRLHNAKHGYISPVRQPVPWISIVNKSDGKNNATVYTNSAMYQRQNLAGGKGNMYYGTDTDNGGFLTPGETSIYQTTIPIGQWVTMRIKLNMYNASSSVANGPAWDDVYPNVSGGSSLVYFPDLVDSDGQMKYAVLAHGQPWGESAWAPTNSGGTIAGISMSGNAAHYPNMTFWLQNMRSINDVVAQGAGSGPSGYSSNNVNNGYAQVDSPISDDKAVDVLVDSISFRNWGPTVTNTSINEVNGMGGLTKIPAGNFMTPAKYPGGPEVTYSGSISVFPSGNVSAGINSPDNYYGMASAPTTTYMSFGFDSSGTIADNTPHPFLMSNYSTGREELGEAITMVSGGYFTSGNYLGLFGEGYQNGWFDNLTVGDDTKNIHITGGANSIDNFVQKGTMAISGAFTDWVRTGNPLVAAKIIAIGENKNTIIVDKPQVFDVPLNTPLCVELNNTSYEYKAKGSGSMGYYDVGPNTEPLVQTKVRQGNTIFLSRPVYQDDAQSPASGVWNFDFSPIRMYDSGDWTGIYQQYYWGNCNATKATISPYQYWMNIGMINMSSSAGWGSWFADPVASGNQALQTRVYDGIIAVSGGSVAGTTFNEFLFNDGIYANKWNINFMNPTENIVDLSIDYGYGVVNTADTENVPDSDGGKGRMGRDYMKAGQNYINLGSYVYTTKPMFNQPFNFLVRPTYMNLFDSLYRCNINTKDATTNKPQIIYGIKDPLPEIEEFTVSPIIDTQNVIEPAEISKLTQTQATDIAFNWRESGDDVNYRMLWVDTDLIENKYHKATCIIPLNESQTTSPPKHYSSASNYITDTGVTFSGTNNTSDIEGVQGWGLKLDGTNQIGVSGVTAGTGYENWLRLMPNTGDKFTHIFHLKPSASGNATFFSATGTTLGVPHTGTPLVWQYEIEDYKVKMKVGTSGATPTLTSTTSYSLDGVEPLAIVFTYDKSLTNNNFKLYVNGKLEDTLDYNELIVLQTGGGGQFASVIGANPDGTNKYAGYIEEISFHSEPAYIPQNSRRFVLPTAQLPDAVSGKSEKYNARLFLFDYHNVRGASSNQVCRSNSTAWKITGLT